MTFRHLATIAIAILSLLSYRCLISFATNCCTNDWRQTKLCRFPLLMEDAQIQLFLSLRSDERGTVTAIPRHPRGMEQCSRMAAADIWEFSYQTEYEETPLTYELSLLRFSTDKPNILPENVVFFIPPHNDAQDKYFASLSNEIRQQACGRHV
jgi:hypothetical protein